MLRYVYGTHGEWFATIDRDANVSVRSAPSGTEVQRLKVDCADGYARIALSRDGLRLWAADYEQHGVRCYDTRTGQCIWARPELLAQQAITLGARDQVLACGMSDAPSFLLHAETGETREQLDAEYVIWCDDDGPDHVITNARGVFLRSEGAELRLAARTHGIVSVAFTGNSVCIGETRGPITCFTRDSGRVRWRSPALPAFHAIPLAPRAGADALRAVIRNPESRGQLMLHDLDLRSGALSAIGPVAASVACGFVSEAAFLVTSEGAIYDTDTAELVARFDIGA